MTIRPVRFSALHTQTLSPVVENGQIKALQIEGENDTFGRFEARFTQNPDGTTQIRMAEIPRQPDDTVTLRTYDFDTLGTLQDGEMTPNIDVYMDLQAFYLMAGRVLNTARQLIGQGQQQVPDSLAPIGQQTRNQVNAVLRAFYAQRSDSSK